MLRFRIFPVALFGRSRYEIRSPSKSNAVRSGWWTAPSARTCARFTSAAGDKRLRRSHRYFFFVKAGPKSGLTWQSWILPTHIESSWRPWWFFRER